MRSEKGVIVWGAGEPGEVETDAVEPVGSTESNGLDRVNPLYRAHERSRLDDGRRGSRGFCGVLAGRGGYSKNRIEIVVGGTRDPPAAGRAIDGDGGCRNTSGESSGWSKNVVKPHT